MNLLSFPKELTFYILSFCDGSYNDLRQISLISRDFNIIINKIVTKKLKNTNRYPRACNHCHVFSYRDDRIMSSSYIDIIIKDRKFSELCKKYVKGDLIHFSSYFTSDIWVVIIDNNTLITLAIHINYINSYNIGSLYDMKFIYVMPDALGINNISTNYWVETSNHKGLPNCNFESENENQVLDL